MEIPHQFIKNLYKALLAFLIVLSVFFIVKVLSEFKSYQMMNNSYNSISLSGHGEVSAVPDIANINFTIKKEAKTAKSAEAEVALIEKKVLDFLKSKNVAEKDIKTEYKSSYPKYEFRYEYASPLDPPDVRPRPPGKNVLIGYESSENISVKIRNIDDTGAIMEGLSATGVSDFSGPNFSIDKEDVLKAEARKKAIEDAKAKAKILAKDLGVRLGKIVSFYEGGDAGGPTFYSKSAMGGDAALESSAPAQVPKGENTVSADVTITYEIK